MKLHFTNDWLRSQIERDPDIECDAGIPVLDASPLKRFAEDKVPQDAPIPESAPEQKTAVLHVLVHQLRRRDKLTVAQLADRLHVSPEEIKAVENDPRFTPKPRTLFNLAKYMEVSPKGLLSVTSEAIAQTDNVADEILEFAARSENLSELSKAERKQLNDFVKFLSSYEGTK